MFTEKLVRLQTSETKRSQLTASKVSQQVEGLRPCAHNELGLCAHRFGGSPKWIEIPRAHPPLPPACGWDLLWGSCRGTCRGCGMWGVAIFLGPVFRALGFGEPATSGKPLGALI